ncbi:hypothetical protein, partial [Salmonella enterica]|uniref:hypothetical protein n=1 Tax=Salmonella enterica TaxID=28901 RepID=UPI001F3D11C0
MTEVSDKSAGSRFERRWRRQKIARANKKVLVSVSLQTPVPYTSSFIPNHKDKCPAICFFPGNVEPLFREMSMSVTSC